MSLMSQSATGNAAINESINPGAAYQLSFVRLHLSDVGGAGSVVVQLDSILGAAWDCIVYSVDVTALKDICWIPSRPIPFLAGDIVTITYPNVNGRTYGITTLWDLT